MGVGAILTAAQFVAQNEAAQQLGITAARRLSGGIYAKIFGGALATQAETDTVPGDALIAVNEKLDQIAADSATRDEMAKAFTILQDELAIRQRRMLWAIGGLALAQLFTIGLLILR